MLFETLIPTLPTDRLSTAIIVVGVMGGILLVYSQFIEAENRRDLMRMIASLAMLSYAIWIMNLIFILTMVGIFAASFIEFIEIYAGYHQHTRKDVDIYKHIGKHRNS